MSWRNNVMLQLGAMSLLIGLDGAIEREESLSTVCRGTDAEPHEITPVKKPYECPACLTRDTAGFLKARKEGRSTYHVVEATEVAEVRDANIGGTKDIINISAHPATDVTTQTLPGDSIYYLSPSKDGHAPIYAMLVDLVKRHPEVAFVGLFTPTSRTGMYQLKVYGDTLVLEGRARPEAIKIKQQAAGTIQLEQTQQAMADQLLTMLATPFDRDSYADTYKTQLDELIASKAGEDGAVVSKSASTKTAASAPVLDLNAMLQAALSGGVAA